MLMLEITPAMVGPDRTRLGLNYIENVMLWPSDADQRNEATKTATAKFIQDAISAVPAARRAADAAEWLDWYALAADAFPLRHLQEQAKKPFVHGVIAGELLGTIVFEHLKTPGSIKLEHFKAKLTTRWAAEQPYRPGFRSAARPSKIRFGQLINQCRIYGRHTSLLQCLRKRRSHARSGIFPVSWE